MFLQYTHAVWVGSSTFKANTYFTVYWRDLDLDLDNIRDTPTGSAERTRIHPFTTTVVLAATRTRLSTYSTGRRTPRTQTDTTDSCRLDHTLPDKHGGTSHAWHAQRRPGHAQTLLPCPRLSRGGSAASSHAGPNLAANHTTHTPGRINQDTAGRRSLTWA